MARRPKSGAGEGIRTPDPNLGKVALGLRTRHSVTQGISERCPEPVFRSVR